MALSVGMAGTGETAVTHTVRLVGMAGTGETAATRPMMLVGMAGTGETAATLPLRPPGGGLAVEPWRPLAEPLSSQTCQWPSSIV